MLKHLVRLAELFYRQPAEKPLTNEERRRELQAYYGLFFVFFVLPLGLCTYLAMGASGDIVPADFLPAPALLGGIVFFLLWLKQKARLEYFYLALFAMVTGVLQLRFTAAYPREFNPADTASFDVFMLAVEGGFGLLLAMAFARSRAVVFQAGLPLLVGLPVILQPVIRFAEIDFQLAGCLSDFVVPACFFLGGTACVLQAVALRGIPAARARQLRLLGYSAGFFALCVLSVLEAGRWKPGLESAHLRVPELLVLVGFSVLALLEYRGKSAPAGQKGFTLIELMIVVAVVGLLAALAGPMYERYQAKSRQGEAKLNLSAIYASEKAFFVEYSAYISSFEALHFQPEGERRFYTMGWNAVMTGTVQSYNGTYGTPTYAKINVPATFGCNTATGTAALPPPVDTDQQTFRVGAAGGIRVGLGCDVWTIDDEKSLSNSTVAL